MHPLHIDPKPMGRIILGTPTKGTMLLLSKIFGDIFGTDTRDRHISIKVVETQNISPAKAPCPKIVIEATPKTPSDAMSNHDWESFLAESVPMKAYEESFQG